MPARFTYLGQAFEKQMTFAPHGHILTNINVWSPDGQGLVYDTRSDRHGSAFDGERIEKVNVLTGEVRLLYESKNGAHCGVTTYSPAEPKVVFILGPEYPTADFQYGASRRQGIVIDEANLGGPIALDARDLIPPFTPGALRGGSHVHVFSHDGQWVSFTYHDYVLEQLNSSLPGDDIDQRNIGICIPRVCAGPLRVSRGHSRNHDGQYFSILVTTTTAKPFPGSDQIQRAFEDAWVGSGGYQKLDGSWQKRSLAFQGEVIAESGQVISELFIVDVPDDPTQPGDGPLEGTATRRPFPPKGVVQRRLTHTASLKYPGIQGPRHWPRSSPDGSRIAFLMKDEVGIVQLWTISPLGGKPVQVTRNLHHIASAFSWNPDGRSVAHVMDNSVFVTNMQSGESVRVTPRQPDGAAPLPEACVFSPDGTKIAYVRPIVTEGKTFNQIFVVS